MSSTLPRGAWLLTLIGRVYALHNGATGGGGPPQGGGGGGGAVQCTTPPCAAALLGDVGLTTASGTDARTGRAFAPGENIFGPFEAGFATQQDNILAGLGCSPGSLGHVAGGIDTYLAEQMVAFQCGVTLPRIDPDGAYISLIDECGGHTNEYHFHERLKCLYNSSAPGHSTKVGEAVDSNKTPIYGKFESTGALPELDACGAHFGVTPDSGGAALYHHHVQAKPPFTIGCFGPSASGGLVSVAECRALYSGAEGCGGSDVVTISTASGRRAYDKWCPCYDAAGSNVADGAEVDTSGAPPAAVQVQFALRAAGVVTDYTPSVVALMRGDLAIAAGVLSSDVDLRVSAASVLLSVTIALPSTASADVATAALTPKLASAAAATSIFTSTAVTVESVVAQPSTATLSTSALSTAALAGIIAGSACALLAIAAALLYHRFRRQRAAKERAGHASA